MRSTPRMLLLVAVLVVASSVGVALTTGVPDFAGGGDDPERELGFRNVTDSSGLDYATTSTGPGNGNSGLYVSDVDRDGRPDLLATGGEAPTLFGNAGGQFSRQRTFEGLNGTVQSAAFVDPDRDGWTDLLLFVRGGEPVFFANDRGTFERRDAGLDEPMGVPVGAAVEDFDGDGDTDVFVVSYGDWGDRTPAGYYTGGAVRDDNGGRNYLLRWDGSTGTFDRTPVGGDARWSLAASAVDLTGDGRPDVHVANDFNNDTVYVNDGDGGFERRVLPGETARNGMSSEVLDANGDATPDVFVTNVYLPNSRAELGEEKYRLLRNYQRFVLGKRAEGNTLLVNDGGDRGGGSVWSGGFDDEADAYGVRKGGWGWAAVSEDFDDDGRTDLFHTTQRVIRVNDTDPHYTYPMLWQRTGEDYRSVDASDAGLNETDGRGAAALDYDGDGDVDLAVTTYTDGVRLYENRGTGDDTLSLAVRDGSGASALGATVSVETGDGEQTEWVTAETDYQSQDSRVRHFGLGDAETATVRVVWPDGRELTLQDVPAGRSLVVTPEGVTDCRRVDGALSTEDAATDDGAASGGSSATATDCGSAARAD